MRVKGRRRRRIRRRRRRREEKKRKEKEQKKAYTRRRKKEKEESGEREERTGESGNRSHRGISSHSTRVHSSSYAPRVTGRRKGREEFDCQVKVEYSLQEALCLGGWGGGKKMEIASHASTLLVSVLVNAKGRAISIKLLLKRNRKQETWMCWWIRWNSLIDVNEASHLQGVMRQMLREETQSSGREIAK